MRKGKWMGHGRGRNEIMQDLGRNKARRKRTTNQCILPGRRRGRLRSRRLLWRFKGKRLHSISLSNIFKCTHTYVFDFLDSSRGSVLLAPKNRSSYISFHTSSAIWCQMFGVPTSAQVQATLTYSKTKPHDHDYAALGLARLPPNHHLLQNQYKQTIGLFISVCFFHYQ